MQKIVIASERTPPVLGWREWVALPQLQILRIKAKLDTGARTSCLHAFFVEPYRKGKTLWVRFGVHPLQRNNRQEVVCTAPVLDRRWVSDSGGHKERRYVIQTELKIGEWIRPIELTLSNRDSMQFRMLLGRTTLSHGFAVNPARSYVLGRPRRKKKPDTSTEKTHP